MNRKFNLGYDYYQINCLNITYYIDIFLTHKIHLYNLQKIDTYTYTFLTSRKYSYTLKKIDAPIEYIKSVGVLHYLTLFFKSKIKWIGILTFIIVFFYTKQHVLNIKIMGTQFQLNEELVTKLDDYRIGFFNKKLNQEEINNLKLQLLSDYKTKIDWINLHQKGDTVYIEYTNKKESEIMVKDARPLVTCKEAVIKEFQVQSGMIITQINQYVLPGEILVSNAIVSTFDETILVNPKGKIFGYTWYDIEQEMDKSDEADNFNTLLLRIRNELSTYLGKDAKIDNEKVLQYEVDDSKIRLRVHYTVIEDIACKGDMNEQDIKTN